MRRIHTSISDRHRQRGFALLLVIGCLLIATVAAVGMTRQSLMLTLEAADTQDQLQRHWESVTLQRAAVSAAVARYGGPPVQLGAPESNLTAAQPIDPEIEFRLRLNRHDYRVVLADESAKANLNTARRLKPDAVLQVLKSLSAGQLTVHRSAQPGSGSSQDARPLRWYDLAPRGARRGARVALFDVLPASSRLTTWGDGRLHVVTASDEALLELSRLVVSDGDSRNWITELRRSFPGRSLADIFREQGFDRTSQRRLTSALALQSNCVSAEIRSDRDASFCVASRSHGGSWRSRVIQSSNVATYRFDQ